MSRALSTGVIKKTAELGNVLANSFGNGMQGALENEMIPLPLPGQTSSQDQTLFQLHSTNSISPGFQHGHTGSSVRVVYNMLLPLLQC